MTQLGERRARVEQLLDAARTLANPSSPASQRLRQRLQQTAGLSRPSIDFALERCLEQHASNEELSLLLERVPVAQRALVSLSANVFVAPLRAVALARAASARVIVRPSRRDPALVEALLELLPGAFELTSELAPASGDQLWAYGADDTMASIVAKLPEAVEFHGHGFGFGAVVVDYSNGGDENVTADARAIALDAALFDQRGCLSPRMICVVGAEASARSLARALAQELLLLEQRLPPGASDVPERLAERRRFLDAATYAFEVVSAGDGSISLAVDGRLLLAPAGRNLHLARVDNPVPSLATYRPHLTCIAVRGPNGLRQQLQAAFPGARCCDLGRMQTPPLDGPVDLRAYVTD